MWPFGTKWNQKEKPKFIDWYQDPVFLREIEECMNEIEKIIKVGSQVNFLGIPAIVNNVYSPNGMSEQIVLVELLSVGTEGKLVKNNVRADVFLENQGLSGELALTFARWKAARKAWFDRSFGTY